MKSQFVYGVLLPFVLKVCNFGLPPVIKPKTMLILRGNDGIGDFVLFSGGLRILRESYPDYHITVLATKRISQLLDPCPFVDEIVIWDIEQWQKSLLYKIRFLYMIRKQGVEYVLEPRCQTSTAHDAMVLISNARYKIGIGEGRIRQKNYYDRSQIYSKLINLPVILNEFEKNTFFVREYIKRDIPHVLPEIWLNKFDRDWAKSFIRENRLVAGQWVIISPGSSDIVSGRRWSIQKYAKIIDLLWDQYKMRVVLAGSLNEALLLDAIDKRSTNNNVLSMPGTMNLRQFAALLRHTTMCIGNDSGPIHMSIAVNTPTVCILGGGHFGKYLPYGDKQLHRVVYHDMDCFQCDWQCKHKSMQCIENISIDDVWETITELLKDLLFEQKTARQCCS